MYGFVRIISLAFLFASIQVDGAPKPTATYQSTINQFSPLVNTSATVPFSTHPFPYYEAYHIPGTALTLHLTLQETINRQAMQACLRSASIWTSFQRQSSPMRQRDFLWEDPAGALFYVESLSRRLIWEEVGIVLKGLRQDLYDESRHFAGSFTIEDQSVEQIIGRGRLAKYTPTLPTAVLALDSQ